MPLASEYLYIQYILKNNRITYIFLLALSIYQVHWWGIVYPARGKWAQAGTKEGPKLVKKEGNIISEFLFNKEVTMWRTHRLSFEIPFMKYPLVKPEYYFTLFQEIFVFVKNPVSEKDIEKSAKHKVYDTIGLYILKLILLIPLVLFFAFVYDPENIQSLSMSERFSPLAFLFAGGIILPFVEEVAFRLSLKFKPIYLTLSSSVLLYYILTKLVFQTKISALDESFLIRIGISFLFGTILYPLVNFGSVKARLTKFWSAHFRSIYYSISVLFAWGHIIKYEINWTNILLLPILTLPQLMSALIYGYIRISFGFQYPLLFHVSNNIIGISLSFLPFTDLILNV